MLHLGPQQARRMRQVIRFGHRIEILAHLQPAVVACVIGTA